MNAMDTSRPLSPPVSPYTPDCMVPDFAALFEHAADGIIVTDASRCVIFAKVAFARMVGGERASIVGHNPAEFIVASELRSTPAGEGPLPRGGAALTLKHLAHSDGSHTAVEIHSTAMADGSTLDIVRDVRRRSMDEQRLRDRQRAVEGSATMGNGPE